MRLNASDMPPTIVTTSWDDGHRTDLRLADRLAAHALKGTFYVALNHPGDKDIGDDETSMNWLEAGPWLRSRTTTISTVNAPRRVSTCPIA